MLNSIEKDARNVTIAAGLRPDEVSPMQTSVVLRFVHEAAENLANVDDSVDLRSLYLGALLLDAVDKAALADEQMSDAFTRPSLLVEAAERLLAV